MLALTACGGGGGGGSSSSSTLPITVTVSPPTQNAQAGIGTQQFTANVQNTTNTAVSWRVNGVTSGDGTVGTITTGGLYAAPASVPSPATVVVAAVSVADPTRSGAANVTITPPVSAPVSVSVSPPTPNVQAGFGTQQFTANVQNTTNTAVTWRVNGVMSGDGTVGTITTGGLYAAPASVPSPATVVVAAVSVADPTRSGAANVTITPPVSAPVSVSVSPPTPNVQAGIGTQQFTANVQNTANTAVTWRVNGVTGGNATIGTITTGGLYAAPASVPSPATVVVTAVSVADPTRSGSANVTITPPVSVSVSPPTPNVQAGIGTQQFTANVQNTANTAVTWRVNGVTGGNATIGTITTGGLYAAPASVPSPATVVVTAVSVADPTRSGSANVTITSPGSGAVTVSPHRVALTISQTEQFSSVIAGGGSVNWTVDTIPGGNGSVGTISGSGLYVPSAAAVGVHTITATNAANSSLSDSATVAVTDLGGVYTYHADLARTGQNLREYALTPATVSGGNFGKRWSCLLDGEAYAQPLYVANVVISGGSHNVVIVATQHDSVYAFDADDPGCTTYWNKSFLGAGVTTVSTGDLGGCLDIIGEYGITGTPVVDPASRTVYVVAKTKESGSYFQRLHALDLTTGNEMAGSPVTIQPSVSSGGGTLKFDPLWQNQRPGLVLSGGGVFVAWAGHCDFNSYHGWLTRYDATSLAQTAVFNSTPLGSAGGIWMSGGAPAVDSSLSLFFSTGNGTFDDVNSIVPPLAPNNDFGMSFLKLDPVSLAVQDFYTPSQEAAWSGADLDISSAGMTVLPDSVGPATHPNVLVGADKQGHLWMLDRTNMSRYSSSSDNVVQFLTLPNISSCKPQLCVMATPGYWNRVVFIAVNGGPLMALPLTSGLMPATGGIATPASQSREMYNYPSPTPMLSASSPTANGIVWVLDTNANGTDNGSAAKGPAVLRAYDATNLGTTLFSSSARAADTAAGTAVKFTLPVIANGHVYVAGGGALTVYGLAP